MSVLSEELRRKIEAYMPRYPNKQAVTLPALHLVQDELRCVPHEAVREIADMLDLSPAEVSDTMTFYGFFRFEDKPLGRLRVWVCRSLPCMLRGGEEILNHLCQRLNTSPGSRTADGRVSLEFAECLGACEEAPCMLVNDSREGPLRPDAAEKIIAWWHQLRGEEVATPELVEAMRQKGREICFAVEGSDERRNLQACQANALNLVGLLILQPDARKIEVLEEFLHDCQERIGIGAGVDRLAAEIHVKEFMLRHRRLLGISDKDANVLEQMLGGYKSGG